MAGASKTAKHTLIPCLWHAPTLLLSATSLKQYQPGVTKRTLSARLEIHQCTIVATRGAKTMAGTAQLFELEVLEKGETSAVPSLGQLSATND